ncbi:MAG: hypothetical protein Q9161_004012 [Pseudevernia consocians]
MSSETYTGPSVAHMLETRTFAPTVISNHNTSNAIFDDTQLAILREFSADPSKKDEILSQHDMTDAPGDRPGQKAAEKGSLTGVVIARYGTSETAFQDGDIEKLNEWFESGGGK